jgi:hypothetical protein
MEPPARRLLKNARREAAIVLLAWLGCLVWVVGYSSFRGYTAAPVRDSAPPNEPARVGEAPPVPPAVAGAPLETVIGVPRWAFFGIALPWLAATLFTIVFGAFLLRDDDLGAEHEPVTGGSPSS